MIVSIVDFFMVVVSLQGGNKCDRHDRLASSKLRSTGNDTVVNAFSSSLLSDNLNGRRTTSLLVVNLLEGRLLRAVHAKHLHGGEYTQVIIIEEEETVEMIDWFSGSQMEKKAGEPWS
jgi:hypothetical protein